MSSVKARRLRLILGDQLHSRHSWFRRPKSGVTFVLMELGQETAYVRHHIQKIAAFFASMRAFAAWLRSRGHDVVYLALDDRGNSQDLAENISTLVKQLRCDRFEYLLPDEYRLDCQLRDLSSSLSSEVEAFDSEHFLTTRQEVGEFFGEKQWRMENLYRHLRRQHNVLMDGNDPEGGEWNYDTENRRKYTGEVPVPAPRLFVNDVRDIVALLTEMNVGTVGEIDASRLAWPVTRRQALSLLGDFVDKLIPHFGTYQDAMSEQSWSLFHSRLSFAMNCKMVSPREVIDRAVTAWRSDPNRITLPQVEGFVRQILGWREYMRGVYWAHMPRFGNLNYFGHTAPLPHYFWDGDTRMNCVARTVGQTMTHAYAHHIQRLMVTGNFALLAGIHPDELDAWYLGVYIDAIEWVEMPNTRGMSQFADGGITASKPYVSTANYINSMSDYCRGCHYDRTARYGERACPFNSLHWDFYERHRGKLQDNARVGMMYRVWDRMETDERRRILKQAGDYKARLEEL